MQQTAWARTQNISETKNGNQVTQVQCLPKWHIAQDCLCIVHSFPKIVTAKDATRPHLGQKCGHISTTLFAWKKKTHYQHVVNDPGCIPWSFFWNQVLSPQKNCHFNKNKCQFLSLDQSRWRPGHTPHLLRVWPLSGAGGEEKMVTMILGGWLLGVCSHHHHHHWHESKHPKKKTDCFQARWLMVI